MSTEYEEALEEANEILQNEINELHAKIAKLEEAEPIKESSLPRYHEHFVNQQFIVRWRGRSYAVGARELEAFYVDAQEMMARYKDVVEPSMRRRIGQYNLSLGEEIVAYQKQRDYNYARDYYSLRELDQGYDSFRSLTLQPVTKKSKIINGDIS